MTIFGIDVNLVSIWLFIAILIATIDWMLVVQICLKVVGWIDKEEHHFKFFWKDVFLFWPLRICIIYIVIAIMKPDSYLPIGEALIAIAILNAIFGLLRGIYILTHSDDSEDSTESGGKATLRNNVTYCTFLLLLLLILVGSVGGSKQILVHQEFLATKKIQQIWLGSAAHRKIIYPEQVVSVEDKGSTVWEIYPKFDKKSIYRVREDPSYNQVLANFTNAAPLEDVTRERLLLLSWSGDGEKVGELVVYTIAGTIQANKLVASHVTPFSDFKCLFD